MAGRKKTDLGHLLVSLGFIGDDDFTSFVSQQYRIPTVDLAKYEIDLAVLAMVSKELCETHRLIPISRAGSSLVVAMSDPVDEKAIDALRGYTGLSIEPVIATETAITDAIATYYVTDNH
jgi:type IV pilus assembly protein PilB